MPFKYVKPKRKPSKQTNKPKTDKAKFKRFSFQYTKFMMTIILILTVIICLATVYVNLKTGNSLDSLSHDIIDALWKIVLTYGAKSYLETKAKNEMDYLQSINANNDITSNNEEI